ncbi:putative xyloglucan endotransglucosylase/hydrolase protein 8 [Glycine max]|nr:putative xyloglucan endotransglucosylase/hydrolase protein 8 [Glycine max]
MAMERVSEFPHTYMDRRPRKRVPKVVDLMKFVYIGYVCFRAALFRSTIPLQRKHHNHWNSMCSENGAGPKRDELDFEFLGNKTGESYLIQTNVYKNETGGRKMRHMLWFDPTEDYHTYSIHEGRIRMRSC